jgi:tetratricopeptide (TPR) repeat protein
MMYGARDSGISCDEMLHYGQSVKVYNFFATGGKDSTALLDSPLNLKYYGQAYDNIVTFITKWSGIEDIYTFRHFMSAVMGWLTIVITALFARWLKDYSTALVVIFLFAISPFFIGHSYNNLKDIPFAFAYIAGIWMSILFIEKSGRISIKTSILLTLSIAFCISIRAGGLILICYLFFFMGMFYFIKYLEKGKVNSREIIRKTAWIFVISLVALLLGAALWPFAIKDPLRNTIEAYKVMAHYPATFRQLFEGRLEWSDYMPWYYLIKSMAITIPLTVLAGSMIFLLFTGKIIRNKHGVYYLFLAFTIVFPLIFAIISDSNLYSSWRQFLFIYPGIVILSAAGLSSLFDIVRHKYLRITVVLFFLVVSVHPVRFMIKNHPYEYLYYNELTGGVKGAYGNYELDYYYTSQTEASEWLIRYLQENKVTGPVKISATYSVDWQFRNQPGIEISWMRFEERSMKDWDYAIIVNRYIPPYQLKNNIWPPDDALKIIYADSVPVCAIIERKSKDDFLGSIALQEGRFNEAIDYFKRAVEVNTADEMIFYNFAGALYKGGYYSEADSILKKGLELYPGSDLILMYLGNIAVKSGQNEKAMGYYRDVIKNNRKFLEAYVALSGLVSEYDIQEARKLLRECLIINPHYKEAIRALGDTYRESNPGIARKYYDQL